VSVSCASEYSVTVRQQAFGLEGIFASGPYKLAGEYSGGDYRGNSANTLTGKNEVSYDTKTYYVEAGWFLTGEKYASSYKNGVFSSFKPTNDFDLDNGKWGALEALFRFEAYDVDNVKVTGSNGVATTSTTDGQNTGGGRIQGSKSADFGGAEAGAKTYTGGIRWILNPNVVLRANYSYTKFDDAFAPIDVTGATGVKDGAALIKDEKLLMFRTQFMF
jgi:phosphate-selective porin OprO/OprP